MRSAHRFKNQLALSPTKLPLFHVFCRLHQFNFLKKYVIDNKATSPLDIFQVYLFNGNKYISNSICLYYFFNSYLIFILSSLRNF